MIVLIGSVKSEVYLYFLRNVKAGYQDYDSSEIKISYNSRIKEEGRGIINLSPHTFYVSFDSPAYDLCSISWSRRKEG